MKLLALFVANFYFAPVNCSSFFGEDYKLAVSQLEADATMVAGIAHEYNIDALTVESIVFPEYIRNNALSALVEQSALDIMYVEMGSDAVDFSIGKFQVKPSFAHCLEKEIKADALLAKKYKVLLPDGFTQKFQRANRISRLKDEVWQTRYLCAFVDFCERKYGLTGMPSQEKVKFLATVYNVGFGSPREEIEKKYALKVFPYGPKFKTEQVSYWEVALDYYTKHKEQE